MDGLWAAKSEGVGLLSMQLVSKFSNLCGPDPPTSQTDGRTTCNLNTALCTKVYRTVKTFLVGLMRSADRSK